MKKKQEGRAPDDGEGAADGPSTSAAAAAGDAVAHLKSLQGLLARQADALTLRFECRGSFKDMRTTQAI